MAIGDGTQWDETNPQQSTLANTIDSYDRDLRVGVRLRMANEHVWPSIQTGSSQAGQHLFITLRAQTAAPGLSGSQVASVYVDSTPNLIFNNGSTNYTLNAGFIVLSATDTTPGYLASKITTGLAIIGTTAGSPLGVSAAFGAWSSLSAGTTYQATADGLVVAFMNNTNNNSLLRGYSDSSTSPSTLRSASSLNSGAAGASYLNIMFPVKKGDYFHVNTSGTADTITMYFVPLGS